MEQFHSYHANLRLNGRCPVCNAAYDGKFTVLGEQDQDVLTYARCPSCGAALLTVLSVEGRGGLHAIGLITDQSVDEVVRFERGDPITANDLLDLHAVLEEDRPADELIHHQS